MEGGRYLETKKENNNKNIDLNNDISLDEFARKIKTTNANANIILQDLKRQKKYSSFFHKYNKEDIIRWLNNPSYFSDKLIEVSNYLYIVSNHYRRLIKYFSDISLLCYVLVPNSGLKENHITLDNYKKYADIVSNMNIGKEFKKTFTPVFRDDVAYCFIYKAEKCKNFYIKTLPYKYCKITYVKNGVYGFAFDFSYFNGRRNKLNVYGEYFKKEYYKLKRQKDISNYWVDIPLECGFAIKWDESVDYPLPPLVGVLTSLFDLEDYKKLKKTKNQIENYKLLELIVPYEKGQPLIPFSTMIKYYDMIQDVVPEDIGIAMTPGKLEEHSFERAGQTDTDLVEQATNNFFNEAGVSQLLFSSDKAGTSVLSASTEIDATYIYSLYRQVERVVNEILKSELKDKLIFRFKLLDVNVFNKKDKIEEALKQAQYGIGGSISTIAALNNNDLSEIESLTKLENNIFKFHDQFKPLSSSHTQSGSNSNTGGAPTKEDDDLSESGVKARERDEKNE